MLAMLFATALGLGSPAVRLRSHDDASGMSPAVGGRRLAEPDTTQPAAAESPPDDASSSSKSYWSNPGLASCLKPAHGCHQPADVEAFFTDPGGEICTEDEGYFAAIAPILAAVAAGEKLVYLNAGANKGFNVAAFLHRFGGAAISAPDWYRAQTMFTHNRSNHVRHASMGHGWAQCGVCGACHGKWSPLVASPRAVDAHAFELMADNAAWLRWACEHFGGVCTVVHAPISNASEEVHVPAQAKHGGSGLGWERGSIGDGRGTVAMDAVALDDYIDAHGIGFAHVVSIDTEGHDALVVRGLARALGAARVGVLEFEFGKEFSPSHGYQRLSELLAWLDQLGYGCYVETRSGCLVPTRSPSDGSALRSPANGNMVCGARGAYVNALAQFAKRCACCTIGQLRQCDGVWSKGGKCIPKTTP